jgi:hypothetical protein
MKKLALIFPIGMFIGIFLLPFNLKGKILAQCYDLSGYVYYLPTKDAPAQWSDEKTPGITYLLSIDGNKVDIIEDRDYPPNSPNSKITSWSASANGAEISIRSHSKQVIIVDVNFKKKDLYEMYTFDLKNKKMYQSIHDLDNDEYSKVGSFIASCH